jgi:hypothetical protein
MTKRLTILCLAMITLLLPIKLFSQVLETEDSKPLLPRQFLIGTGLEFQTSKEGTELALPIEIEYGLSRKFTLLVEPVGFTSIQPKEGAGAKGIGDLEITLFYQIIREKKVLPSISVSLEVKVPTTKDTLIGTGKTDFTPYLIASKTIGKFFTSVNFSYTFLGKPEGVDASNLFNYALGTIFTASKKSILFAELYGNTSSIGGVETPETGTSSNPELSGGETVIAVGYGFYLKKELLLSFGVNYDNNNAFLFRPGIEWKFGGKQ